MKKLLTILFALLAAPAFGQGLQLPNNLPANTVMGRIGTAGQAQAIPFATLTANLWGAQSANTVFAGPTTAPSTLPAFRALVGADLPNPSSSTLGGVQSLATASHFFMTGISTSGVPSAAQPACADLSNSVASCSTDTTNATNISSGTLNTARLPSPFTNGTRSGNTSTFATTTGTLTNTHCANFDGNGNIQDSGSACAGSSAVVLLETLSPSAVSSINTAASWSGYTSIEIVITNLTGSAASTLSILYHSNAAYQNTSYISGMTFYNLTGSPGFGTASTSTTGVILNSATTIGLNAYAANTGLSWRGIISGITSTTADKPCFGQGYAIVGTTTYVLTNSGTWNGGQTAVDGAQFAVSSGTMTGTIKIYGIL